jgi:hypothetical protein
MVALVIGRTIVPDGPPRTASRRQRPPDPLPNQLRSFTLLGMAFAGVVFITVALATILAPAPAVSSGAEPGPSDAASSVATPSPIAGDPGIGGALVVSGDREGTLALARESYDTGYALVGSDGRITFEGTPPTVAQISYEGWEFFPEPGDCTLTPGDIDHETGIGQADLSCRDLADIRGNGVITVEGRVGMAADMIGQRGVPPSGGSLAVGDETWSFEGAFIVTWGTPAIAGRDECNMQLVDEAQASYLCFSYDAETHRADIIEVGRDGETALVPEGACTLDRAELGKPNPRDVTVELTIECAAVEVPGIGTVPIGGTVVVDELGDPF